MRTIKQIALSAALTFGALSAVMYTSCNNDPCKDVVCQNGGTCADGNCTCPTGVGGTNCETIYRTTYTNTYKGNGSDNATPANTYTDWKAVLTTVGTDLTKMELVLKDNVGNAIVTLPITFTTFSATSSTFTVTSTVANGFTYTGTGTINATTLSNLTLNEKENATSLITVYTFTNMTKQ